MKYENLQPREKKEKLGKTEELQRREKNMNPFGKVQEYSQNLVTG
jgi:hypothetical protein